LKKNLAEAQDNIDIAVDRMRDAEDYASWVDAQAQQLKQKAVQYKKSGLVNFAFGGISFGIGAPLIAGGIAQGNGTMVWSGIGSIGAGTAVWFIGHQFFNWW